MLTAERLREVLGYDPLTGVFTWREGRRNQYARAGSVAGTLTWKGYVHIGIDRRYYGAHQLAWLYTHGEWARPCVDHRNGDRADNRIDNLRRATNSQNGANVGPYKTNTSGFRGVSPANGRWVASISKDGHQTHIGTFGTPEEAHRAYVAKAMELFGEFARGG